VRLVELERALAGMVLARDVPGTNPVGPPLMCAGLVLTPGIVARAEASGVRCVWVDDELGRGVEPPPPLAPHTWAAALQTIARVQDAARWALAGGRAIDAPIMREVADVAEAIAHAIRNGEGDPGAQPVADPHGQWHALRVTTLGLAIGERHLRTAGWVDHTQTARFDRIEQRLALLGVGLLLHDIGELALADPSRAGARADAQALERHTLDGAAVLTAALAPLQVRTVVRHHHERWDGGGYPDRRAGTSIHQLARIAAVADSFEELVAPRTGGAHSRAAAVAAIEAGSGTAFEPAIVEVLGALVLPYPVGHEVVLPDGRHGVVVHVDPMARLAPTVRVPRGPDAVEELLVDMSAQFGALRAPADANAA